MTRKVSSGTPWEPVAGYSRAVAAGDFVFVAGCTSVADGVVVHEGDAGAQTTQAITNVARALDQLGAGLGDVVRTRMFVTDISRWREVGAVHAEVFGDISPVATMVEVSALIAPEVMVEIEVDAYVSGANRPAASGR